MTEFLPSPRAVLKTAIIFLAAFALYFLTRSPGLDEWDSVQFAMGVHQFNMWEHHPHPPGYPLFIFFGWLAEKLFDCGPIVSLHFASAAGGAAFVAVWFCIVRAQFNERLAWWLTVTLAVTPAIWMTATKLLTDTPAAALLSAEILAAIFYARRQTFGTLLAASLCGAAGTGFRPQLVLVAAVILATGLKNSPAKRWFVGFGIFVAANLAWLVPTSYLQAQLNPSVSAWRAYFVLIHAQWVWRFSHPSAYIGAGDWSLHYLGKRVAFHFLGWFGLGFGFLESRLVLVIGTLIALAGLILYVRSQREPSGSQFWKFHAPWSLVLVAMVFISLPAAERYYLMIFPLLLIPALRGFLQLRGRWSLLTIILPVFLASVTMPLAFANHREQAPPVRTIEYLERLYPRPIRKHIVLLLKPCRRHAQWYAPDFDIIDPIPEPSVLREITKNASAIYTDDRSIPLPNEWHTLLIVEFKRPLVIYQKHYLVPLFLIIRQEQQ